MCAPVEEGPLSVVVPLLNLTETIGDDVSRIRRRVEAALGEPIELIRGPGYHRPPHQPGYTEDENARLVAA
jgi:nitrogenase molybdenum-iron protein alpha/beta subunit